MDLGARLRQARLEAGLSQRQLCGETVTRNMLSQIENGSARPSMETLRYFAMRLGKPIGYFLEEQAVTSPNQAVMAQARQATDSADVIAALQAYQSPDEVFDAERWLLAAQAYLELAERALAQQRMGYCAQLLEKAAQAGQRTSYYTPQMERCRLLLCYQAGVRPVEELACLLPDNTTELLLRAEAALTAGRADRCLAFLEAAQVRQERWFFLRAEALVAQKAYAQAARAYQEVEKTNPQLAIPKLELCYRELEDYKMAYHYACLRR